MSTLSPSWDYRQKHPSGNSGFTSGQRPNWMPLDAVVERLRVRPGHQRDWTTSARSFEATWWDFLLVLQPEIVTWLVRERLSRPAGRAATGDDPVVCGQPKITRWPQATA